MRALTLLALAAFVAVGLGFLMPDRGASSGEERRPSSRMRRRGRDAACPAVDELKEMFMDFSHGAKRFMHQVESDMWKMQRKMRQGMRKMRDDDDSDESSDSDSDSSEEDSDEEGGCKGKGHGKWDKEKGEEMASGAWMGLNMLCPGSGAAEAGAYGALTQCFKDAHDLFAAECLPMMYQAPPAYQACGKHDEQNKHLMKAFMGMSRAWHMGLKKCGMEAANKKFPGLSQMLEMKMKGKMGGKGEEMRGGRPARPSRPSRNKRQAPEEPAAPAPAAPATIMAKPDEDVDASASRLAGPNSGFAAPSPDPFFANMEACKAKVEAKMGECLALAKDETEGCPDLVDCINQSADLRDLKNKVTEQYSSSVQACVDGHQMDDGNIAT